MGFFRILKTQVFSLYLLPARLWRSTGPVDRTQSRSTGPVDRRAQNVHAGLPIKPVDRAVDRPESRCSLVQGPVDR